MSEQSLQAVIVGAGFSGIAMAIALQKQGIDNFIILEKAEEFGGTWRENTYPGAECDIASALYSYSFEQNASWNFKWSDQAQIHAYQLGVAKKYGLYSKVKFCSAVKSASYEANTGQWFIRTEQGDTYTAQHFISAVGQLHKPSTPSIQGQDLFQGVQFHSADWQHEVDLRDKRVAVIGNAASALQFIPKIAKVVKQLTVYQRSANWVTPKRDRPYSKFEQWLSARIPFLTKLYRFRLWLRNECLVLPTLHNNRFMRWLLERESKQALYKQVSDPDLREKLTPDYPIGAKRILLSDEYYQALTRSNVVLQTSPISTLDAEGVVCENGERAPFDVIIYGTGFYTNPFLADISVTGVDGILLSEHWQDGAKAYMGVTTRGFPNLFMLYGPNTNLGHNSIILMIEAQATYIARCINKLRSDQAKQIQVKREVEEIFNQRLQDALKKTAFNAVASSWYKDGSRITNNWPHSTYLYMRRMRNIDWKDFEIS